MSSGALPASVWAMGRAVTDLGCHVASGFSGAREKGGPDVDTFWGTGTDCLSRRSNQASENEHGQVRLASGGSAQGLLEGGALLLNVTWDWVLPFRLDEPVLGKVVARPLLLVLRRRSIPTWSNDAHATSTQGQLTSPMPLDPGTTPEKCLLC